MFAHITTNETLLLQWFAKTYDGLHSTVIAGKSNNLNREISELG